MSDKSDGGTASGVWVPSSPSSDSSDSSDSEPYTKRPESGREGKRKRAPHKTRSPRGGRRAHAKQPKHRSRGRSSHSSAHSNGSPSAASELPESGTEAPESGSTSSMGVSVADAGNDGCGVVALDELVYVPELDRKVFESWDVLEAYLRTYSRRTFQINACAQETANWEVRKTKQATGHNHVVSSEAYQEMDVLEWIKANSVWEQLKTAASSMDLETEKLFFFGVINYDLNHWFDVSANLSNGVQPSADWR
ncbi:hypothetical protein PI124_g10119 [Phytophthora idaei]|nr:hypothetical protein PI124_g10119 [Phytophthora idaei]